MTGSTGEQVGEVNSSGCLTSSRVQFSMYTLPCTMSCPSMRTFRRVSCGPSSGTRNKTRAGLGFDASVVACRPRRLEEGEEGVETFGIRLSARSKTSAALSFDAFAVTCRPRRLEEEGDGIRLSTSGLSELEPAIVILLALNLPRSISSSNACVPSTWRTT